MNDAGALSLIIPVFNGAKFLAVKLEEISQWMMKSHQPIELIIVNDGSSDGTRGVIADFVVKYGSLACTIVNLPENRGKGYAIREGFKRARWPWVAFTDADIPYGLEVLERMMGAVRADASIYLLYGSRAHHDSGNIVDYGWIRRLGRYFFSIITTFFLTADAADTNCGVKMFRSELTQLAARVAVIDRFAFDMELFAIARVNGWKYQDFPVQLTHRKESSVRLVVDTFLMLRDMVIIRWQIRQDKYVRH
ncbi:MAG: glycosyltransferase [Candidatus Magasanikbacteria bacterium]|nr:glycosyltransferase [Candidatus Magasanikbacteria bacterium]